jgi:hypothetical protein
MAAKKRTRKAHPAKLSRPKALMIIAIAILLGKSAALVDAVAHLIVAVSGTSAHQ